MGLVPSPSDVFDPLVTPIGKAVGVSEAEQERNRQETLERVDEETYHSPPPGTSLIGTRGAGLASTTLGRLAQGGTILGIETLRAADSNQDLNQDLELALSGSGSAGTGSSDGSESPLVSIARFARMVTENGRAILLGVVALVVVYTFGQLLTINVGDSTS